MSEFGVIALFLGAFITPFLALFVAVGGHWLFDRAWRQW